MRALVSAQVCARVALSHGGGQDRGLPTALDTKFGFTILRCMGAAATVAAGPLTELKCSEAIAVLFAAEGETSAAVNPGGPPQAPVGSTPFLPHDLGKPPANPQEG